MRVPVNRLGLALVLVLGLCVYPGMARAVMPDEVLTDKTLEARARNLSQQLRCLVCQNQSIDDSAAPLARDLRLIVRERLSRGDSDQQAMAYIVARYGNFVLLEPPFETATLLLWFGPAAVLLLSGGIFLVYMRRRSTLPQPLPAPLDAAERRLLAALNGDTTP